MRVLRHVDLLVAVGLALVAVLARGLEPGSFLRLVLTVPFLALVPGYLVLQTARPHGHRGVHALAALGLSLPIVGLLALLTSLVDGGFTATAIVATTTIAVLVLAGAAWALRLRRLPTSQPEGHPVEA